ncbi:hypothetical protein [Levilactobacillus bambusae]|uniref:Uncharacterized protein n=1 Tax=Levilactobacillus bambusae TaxID=2024736 RepID=A0A2V1MY14_9LACO|nr:hypothetical protein [Levilactobacillus bambusae]PWF99721.1 hypothetical protein DCM90_06585 [Levilactobacillus bambusae]
MKQRTYFLGKRARQVWNAVFFPVILIWGWAYEAITNQMTRLGWSNVVAFCGWLGIWVLIIYLATWITKEDPRVIRAPKPVLRPTNFTGNLRRISLFFVFIAACLVIPIIAGWIEEILNHWGVTGDLKSFAEVFSLAILLLMVQWLFRKLSAFARRL